MNELEKIAPRLSKMKKDLPCKVPDNYFDDFSSRLQKKIEQENTTYSIHKSRIIKFIKPAIGIAASIAVAALIIYSTLKFLPPENQTNSIASNYIPLTEEDGIMELIEKIDETSFFSLLNESLPGEAAEEEIIEEEILSYICTNISEYEIFLDHNY
ncbi:MAG: hypothetical protein PHH93_04500 [Prolixibacteraceae bacterium]|nr:hypothetical protein [Prolixibacteraceae bacterium]